MRSSATTDPLDAEAARLGYDDFVHLLCVCYLPDSSPPIITLCGLDRTHDQFTLDDAAPECIACLAYRDAHKICPRCHARF